MSSRLFRGLKRWKESQGHKGGRGNTSPSEFMRVPVDCLSDFDDLIEGFREMYKDYPDSPRNARLFALLDRIDEMLPPERTD